MDLAGGIREAFANLPAALQIMGLMVLFAVGDFISALVVAGTNSDFHGTRLGEWIRSKGLPIVTVALLYGLDQATHLFTVQIGGFDLGVFGALAYAQGISFIAAEGFSIVKNLKGPVTNDPVPPPAGAITDAQVTHAAVLTDADAQADLAGTPRPDNPGGGG